MTTDDFRRIALSMPGAEELSGLGYPNFRAGRRSFATIEDAVALIRLTRDQQAAFIVRAPETFALASSGWGQLGTTIVRLEAADEAMLRDALATAWRNVTGVPIDPFKVGDADNVNDAVDSLADIDAKTTDIGAADVPDAAADVPHVVAADAVNGPGINVADIHDGSVGDVVDRAHIDTADVPDVGNRASGADGRADVGNISSVNVADAAKAEPPDDLRRMIERLRAYWGPGPTT